MCLIFEIFQTTKQLYNHVQYNHWKRHSEFNHQTPGINPGKNLGGHNMFHHLSPQTDLLSYMTIVYPGSQLRFHSGPQWITSICSFLNTGMLIGFHSHFLSESISMVFKFLFLWWSSLAKSPFLFLKSQHLLVIWHHSCWSFITISAAQIIILVGYGLEQNQIPWHIIVFLSNDHWNPSYPMASHHSSS